MFLQQPSDGFTQAALTPVVRVAIEDAHGNIVLWAHNRVRVNLAGVYGLGGTLEMTAHRGIATFANLAVQTAGNYRLAASSPGLLSGTSDVFSIIAANMGNGTTILQSTPVSMTASPGGAFAITYNWLAVPLQGQSSVFVDFIDSLGNVQFQDNVQPPVLVSQWAGPTSYTHTIVAPSTAPAGNYRVVAGLSTASGNEPLVAGPAVIPLADDEYQIGTLLMVPPCSILSFGAVGDSVTNNAAAIQSTFNYAAANQCTALIPAGTFAYSGVLTATSIAVGGVGAASILKAQDTNNEALIVAGTGGVVSNLQMQSIGSTRLAPYQASMIWVNGAQNFIIQNVLVNGASGVGIFDVGGFNGLIENNTVENTLADSITNTSGASYITVKGNRILSSGDDGISNNSYAGDGDTVNHITIEGNTVLGNLSGRGLEISGGSNLNFTGNYIDNPDGYTDMYIASEVEWNTQSVSNVVVSGNTFVAGGPNQGSAIIYNSEGNAATITGVTISGNQFVDPNLSALQYAGNGALSGIVVENNVDYSDGPVGFSIFSNSNPVSSYVESQNQVLSPSLYTTPLVVPGGGCNFAGC